MPALILLSFAWAFTSTNLGEADQHARVTRRAWGAWVVVGGLPLSELLDSHRFVRLVERPDGVELSILLDRLTAAWLPMGMRWTDHALTTGRYAASHHFDRNLPDRGSVEAFLDGAAFLREQYGVAVDPAVSAAASVVALARAAHALEDFHAHSNFPELTTASAPPVIPQERALWPDATRWLPGAAAVPWYVGEDPSQLRAALEMVSDCLAPWGRATACDGWPASEVPAVQASLGGVLVLTYVAGGDPPADDLSLARRGEPAWCGSSDAYQCFTRGIQVHAEIRAPRRACASRYESDAAYLPREVEFVHDCYAKDSPDYGLTPLSNAAAQKRVAFHRAQAYAALRVAVLLERVRRTVGEARWSSMMEEAERIARGG